MPSPPPPSPCAFTCLLFSLFIGLFHPPTRPLRGFAGFPTRSPLSCTWHWRRRLRTSLCQPTWRAVPQNSLKPGSLNLSPISCSLPCVNVPPNRHLSNDLTYLALLEPHPGKSHRGGARPFLRFVVVTFPQERQTEAALPVTRTPLCGLWHRGLWRLRCPMSGVVLDSES